ncbi:hypothetical protein ACLMAJ_26870 [Nocardia sp. KC 131]|uniref:hypothetical protein n=1 Tax=Nocardia arseniciresistens TaxID=3392119 RepID=UPI00398F26B7
MEERIGGKIFRPSDPDNPIPPELMAKAMAAFAELNAREPEYDPGDLPPRFRDDLLGTEFEQTYLDAEARIQQDRDQDQ